MTAPRRIGRRNWRRPLCAALALSGAVLVGAAGPRARATAWQASVPATLVAAASGDGARLTRLVATGDDVYAIDDAAHNLRRYILHGLPYAQQFTQVMRWKEGANGLIMGRPLDLFAMGQRLLILDSVGALWSYWESDYARAIVPFRLQSNQGIPAAVALRGADLLVLDPARREIWRYAPGGGGYDTVPVALSARPLAQLAGAVRLAASRDALLVLRADGEIVSIPWARPNAARLWRLDVPVVGLWSSPAIRGCLVAMGQDVALLAPTGTLLWRRHIVGLGAQTLRDITVSPQRRLFVLTSTRILLVHASPPGI